MLSQLVTSPPAQESCISSPWEFTFSRRAVEDQAIAHAGETVAGSFDLVPFINILPEEELLLHYRSRPENHHAKWWHGSCEETILFTRPVTKVSFWAQLKRLSDSDPDLWTHTLSTLTPQGSTGFIKVLTVPYTPSFSHPSLPWLQ